MARRKRKTQTKKNNICSYMARLKKEGKKRVLEIEEIFSKSKRGKKVLELIGNFGGSKKLDVIRIYLARERKRKKKGGKTAPARIFIE